MLGENYTRFECSFQLPVSDEAILETYNITESVKKVLRNSYEILNGENIENFDCTFTSSPPETSGEDVGS